MPQHSWKPCGLPGSWPGAAADLQSEGRGRHSERLALQMTAAREIAAREPLWTGREDAAPSLHHPPTMSAALRSL